jgi:hypothetical protein
MRLIFASIFGFLAVLPAFAAAKLPAVDVTNGGVSARSAFGDFAPRTVSAAPSKRVVARRASTNVAHNTPKTNIDILSPNLPSSNLWAENTLNSDAPLRMPSVSEVAVLHNEFELPDESLDYNFAIDNTPVTRSQVANELESTMNRMAEIDAQIAKLSELQRRANNSVKQRAVSQVVVDDDDDVKISRTVVPMEEPDVLIRSVEKHTVSKRPSKEPTDSLAGLSPSELRKAFRKTFLSENKHLSAMRSADAEEYDNTSITTARAGFTAETNLSEMGSGIRPFEIKVSFRNSDSALSRDNYTLLTTFAGIVVNDPKRAVQVLIPKDSTVDSDDRKLTARRLAIIEQVLKDSGVSEQRIMPVLSNRDDDGALVLRNIDSTQYETLTKQQRNQFGKTTTKTYKSMTW